MSRRKQSSTFNDLIAVSMKIPVWANVFAAVVLFAGLRYYGGSEAPWITKINAPQDLAELGHAAGSQILKSFCYLGQYVFPPTIIFGGLLGWIQRKLNAKKFNQISYAQDPGAAIRSLTWHEFERMTGEAFRRQGFTVKQTKKGPDGGIDLVLNLQSELFLVQCKQWRSQKVSVQVVRELYGVMAAQGAAGGFVVTSGAFTTEARKFSQGTNIQLVDGEKLTRWFADLTDAK
jgi:restriction system protein